MTDDTKTPTGDDAPDPIAPQDPNALQHAYSEDENAQRAALRANRPQVDHPQAGDPPNPTGLEKDKSK